MTIGINPALQGLLKQKILDQMPDTQFERLAKQRQETAMAKHRAAYEETLGITLTDDAWARLIGRLPRKAEGGIDDNKML